MKVVVGGISHETNTFTPIKTSLNNFKERFHLRGNEIIDAFRGTNTPIGGFIEGAKNHHFTIIPTFFAEALPSGPTPRDVFEMMFDELIERIADAGEIDGVLLDLHGSMVVDNLDKPEGIGDVDGHILSVVRDLVGPDIPILVQLDLHANVSQLMVDKADVLIGRETYPEIDMADRGLECANVLVEILKGNVHPTMALHQIPMIWGWNQVTVHPPMSEAIAELHRIEAQENVICGTIATCFPGSDEKNMGASVFIVTNDDKQLAQTYADQLGNWIYNRRADWQLSLPSTREALQKANDVGCYPVIFSDPNDNLGSGAPGDSTGMLRTFIDEKLEDACVLYIVDTEAVAKCQEAGVGAKLIIDVGGKSSPFQGDSVQMNAEVISLVDGHFHYDGPMYAGLAGNMGPSAYIKQDGIHVLLVSLREQPFDVAFAHKARLDVKKMRYIGVKSSVHFRAGFEPWAAAIFMVGEPSFQSEENLVYRRLGRTVYPICK